MKQNVLVLTLACLATISILPVQAAEREPNVVLILADDLGYEDLAFQGSKRIDTPHLDRLSAMGTRFTDGHVSASVCSPSRAGLMTGRYQQRFGHEGNTPRRPFGMDTQERTMGQAFQSLAMRFKYHTERFKTGETDPKFDAKAFRRKFSEAERK